MCYELPSQKRTPAQRIEDLTREIEQTEHAIEWHVRRMHELAIDLVNTHERLFRARREQSAAEASATVTKS